MLTYLCIWPILDVFKLLVYLTFSRSQSSMTFNGRKVLADGLLQQGSLLQYLNWLETVWNTMICGQIGLVMVIKGFVKWNGLGNCVNSCNGRQTFKQFFSFFYFCAPISERHLLLGNLKSMRHSLKLLIVKKKIVLRKKQGNMTFVKKLDTSWWMNL